MKMCKPRCYEITMRDCRGEDEAVCWGQIVKTKETAYSAEDALFQARHHENKRHLFNQKDAQGSYLSFIISIEPNG